MSKKLFQLIAAMAVSFTMIPGILFAAEFSYEGKTVNIIVGLSAGGGYDLYARTIARHLGKHIPGHPTVIVSNMPGAGSVIAANQLYKAIKPDGLTIGHISGNIILNQIFKQPGIEFDAQKFEYVGSPLMEDIVVLIRRTRGITSIESWMDSKTPVKLGGVAPGTTYTDNAPRILVAALGLPIKPVSGYKGTAEIRLAVEGGELDGVCLSWDSAATTWRKGLDTGDIILILQVVPKALPQLPNVPIAINLAKTDEGRKLIEAGLHNTFVFSRPFVLPPGTPKDRVEILRHAFRETLIDKELLEETKAAKLKFNPVNGDDLEKAIKGFFKTEPAILDKVKELIYKK